MGMLSLHISSPHIVGGSSSSTALFLHLFVWQDSWQVLFGCHRAIGAVWFAHLNNLIISFTIYISNFTSIVSTISMFTKACFALFVLAATISGTDACAKRKNMFKDRSLKGKCCVGRSCMNCPPCRDDPLHKSAAPAAAPAPAPAPAPAAARAVISDSNPSCSDWAAAGECTVNPAYMLSACASSCDQQQARRLDTAASAPAPAVTVVTSCDQRNVDYSGRQNCCRCENQFARRLRGARKLGLVSSTIGATTSAATTAGQVTVAANSAYNSQLPCC